MKKFITKVQDLSKKAAEVKQAIEAVPPRISELAQTVVVTAGQVQSLKSEVVPNLSGLNAESEESLIASANEIDRSADLFEAAGYRLTDLELQVQPGNKLIVFLEKISDVSQSKLESLAGSKQNRKTFYAILCSIIEAHRMLERTKLANLEYRGLEIQAGQVPTVRLCWASEQVGTDSPGQQVKTTPVPVTPAGTAPLGQIGTYFERRTPAPSPTVVPIEAAPVTPASPPATTASPATVSPKSEQGDWKRNALERFKKMPDLSKRR